MKTEQSSYVFISHKCDEHDMAYRIVNELEGRGIRCWIDQRDIPGGVDWSDDIPEKLDDAAAVLWIKSPSSASSNEVLDELKLARRHSQRIIPLEVETVAEWQPKWEHFTFLQVILFSDPTWADRVREVLRLDGFVPELATGSVVESGLSNTPPSPRAPGSTAVDQMVSAREHDPFAIIVSAGLTYQLDALNGMGETLIEEDDSFTTGNLGMVTVSSDASVVATSTAGGEVQLWTLGAADGIPGPVLSTALPSTAAEASKLLAVDRPLGQAVRVLASGRSAAYSLMQRRNGEWTAMKLMDGDEAIVSGTVVKDDVLFVLASGSTVWASSRSKRPFSLPKINGVDAAVGIDGRCYLAAWGIGHDGSRLVEVVVEVDSGWERIYRGMGRRAGIVRVMPDVVRQKPGARQTSLVVESGEHKVAILPLL
jgi:hypothetical protein